MLLQNRITIVHGGSGAVGSAVARAYAREGAEVHLTGRTRATLEDVAHSIRDEGGIAHVAVLDAVDRDAVERHAAAVADQSGGIDVCFNATFNDDIQGTPLVDMRVGDVMQPVAKAVTTSFTVATAAARHMVGRGSGVILVMAGGREAIPNLGGSHVAWAALAGLCRQLAAELGPQGVRVAWLLSPGSPEPGEPDPDATRLLLPRRPSYADVANAAVFAASDWATAMTATEINLTGALSSTDTGLPVGRTPTGTRLEETPVDGCSFGVECPVGGDDGEVRILREGPQLDPTLKIVVREHVEVEGSDQPAEGMSRCCQQDCGHRTLG